jgi:hypothetical protein
VPEGTFQGAELEPELQRRIDAMLRNNHAGVTIDEILKGFSPEQQQLARNYMDTHLELVLGLRIQDRRCVPAVLAASSLSGWSELASIRIHESGKGCVLDLTDGPPDARFELVKGTESLHKLPNLAGEGQSLQEYVLRTPPANGGRRTRLRRHCLVDITDLAPGGVPDILDWAEASGLMQPAMWRSPDAGTWLHLEAGPSRNLPDRAIADCTLLHAEATDGPYLPPGKDQAFCASGTERLLPPTALGSVMLWMGGGVSGRLRTVQFERLPIAACLAWPELQSDVPELSRLEQRLEVALRLEPDRRPLAVRQSELCCAVLRVDCSREFPPGQLLNLLDDGDAGVAEMRHFCLGTESRFAKVEHYFELRSASPVQDLRQAGLDAVYLQPERFRDLDVPIPVFVRLGQRLWPEIDWILSRADDATRFRDELLAKLGITDPREEVALLDQGKISGQPLVTKLSMGRPVLESVDVLLEPWKPSWREERNPELPVVEGESYQCGTEHLGALASHLREEFEASLQDLFTDLETAIQEAVSRSQRTRKIIQQASELHDAATAAVEPVGRSWMQFMERVFGLNKTLQDERFSWIEGVNALRSSLEARMAEFERAQVEMEQVAEETRDLLEEEKSRLGKRDAAVKGYQAHASRLAREIEDAAGPRYQKSLDGLEKRLEEVTSSLRSRIRAFRSRRETLAPKIASLQQERRLLETQVAELQREKRAAEELEGVVASFVKQRDALQGVKERAAALRAEVANRKEEVTRLEVESTRELSEAQAASAKMSVKEKELAQLVKRLEAERRRVAELEAELRSLAARRDAAQGAGKMIASLEKTLAKDLKGIEAMEAASIRDRREVDTKKEAVAAREREVKRMRAEASRALARVRNLSRVLEDALAAERSRRDRREELVKRATGMCREMEAAGAGRPARRWLRWITRWWPT